MKKMNEYERHAYLYSAWTALLVPYFLTALIVKSQFPQLINTVMLIGSTFASIAIIYAAIGFYIREVFRSTSKFLFQFPLFKEDETKMPTTEFLLWRNKICLMSKLQRFILLCLKNMAIQCLMKSTKQQMSMKLVLI